MHLQFNSLSEPRRSAASLDVISQLLRMPLFDPLARHHLPLREYMDLTVARMKAIFQAKLINNDMWMGQRDQARFRQMCEHMGIFAGYDLTLASSMVDHLIAGNVVFAQGDSAQVARYHDEIVEMRAVYAFCCTEIHGGTNLRDIKTTVTLDRENNRLVLDSPTPRACKFWIGNVLHAATVGMVLARLIVDGHDEGHHWFRVPLRAVENGDTLPGIRIVSCDPKGGIHGNQVAGLRFQGVALPLDSMMRRSSSFTSDGEFRSPVQSLDARFIQALETFIQERVFPISGARQAAAIATHVTYQFALHRVVVHSPEPETLIEQQLFRQRLYPELLRALALRSLEQAILSRFESDWSNDGLRKELHILAAVGKSVGTWTGLDIIGKCREMCAAQGFHHYNQIITLRTDYEVNVTFAGDNSVMAYQVARNAVRYPRFSDSAPASLGARIEGEIVRRCKTEARGEFTHSDALAIVFARALDLIIDELRRTVVVDDGILADLEHVYASTHFPLFAPSSWRVDATIYKVARLVAILEPTAELVTAPIARADYVERFTAPLYDGGEIDKDIA